MLGIRVITSVILLTFLFVVLRYCGDLGWTFFVLLMLAGAYWEWARLGQFGSKKSILYAIIGGLVSMAGAQLFSLRTFGFPLLALAGIFWIALAPWYLHKVSIGVWARPFFYGVLGWVLITAAGVALILAKTHGIIFLLSALSICFTADIFAYIFGKIFGRHQLAARISPGKSWEGALVGIFSVLAIGWALVLLVSQFPIFKSTWQFMVFSQWHPLVFSFWLLMLGAYSVIGDLFESMLKRSAGLKDSSQLLPGHGGILDRIDAQLPVLPLALLLVGTIAS